MVSFDQDAIDFISEPSDHQPDPGHVYVMARLKATNTATENVPRAPWKDLSFGLIGDANVFYGHPEVPTIVSGEVFALPGGTLPKYDEIFVVPEDEIDSLLLVVSEGYDLTTSEVIKYFSLK